MMPELIGFIGGIVIALVVMAVVAAYVYFVDPRRDPTLGPHQ